MIPVYVRWLDAVHPLGEWTSTKDLVDDPCMLVETIGWLVRQSSSAVQVAVSVSDRSKPDDEQCTGEMTIPLCCIEVMESLPFDGGKRRVLHRRK